MSQIYTWGEEVNYFERVSGGSAASPVFIPTVQVIKTFASDSTVLQDLKLIQYPIYDARHPIYNEPEKEKKDG